MLDWGGKYCRIKEAEARTGTMIPWLSSIALQFAARLVSGEREREG